MKMEPIVSSETSAIAYEDGTDSEFRNVGNAYEDGTDSEFRNVGKCL